MNRRTAVIDATGYRTQTTLTLRGDVLGMTNANGETVEFGLDARGRRTAGWPRQRLLRRALAGRFRQ